MRHTTFSADGVELIEYIEGNDEVVVDSCGRKWLPSWHESCGGYFEPVTDGDGVPTLPCIYAGVDANAEEAKLQVAKSRKNTHNCYTGGRSLSYSVK